MAKTKSITRSRRNSNKRKTMRGGWELPSFMKSTTDTKPVQGLEPVQGQQVQVQPVQVQPVQSQPTKSSWNWPWTSTDTVKGGKKRGNRKSSKK